MDKHELAQILEEIGILLSLQGENPFKVRAYHNAARAIENIEEDLDKIVQEKRLETLPGIGERIAQKIETLVLKGRLPYYEKLKKSVPEGLLLLLKVPGLGSKKVKILYEKLKIQSVEDLSKACQEGKIAKLRGFGLKTQENILKNLERLKVYGKRILWWDAARIGEEILKQLEKLKSVKKAEIAGSFRRKLETIGDLDFLVASSSPSSVMKWFTTQPWVETILSQGPSKSSIRLKQGLQADIRVVPENEFAFALMYFTGSKEHNIRMRHRTIERGFTLNEYGIEPLPKKKQIPFVKAIPKIPTEKDIFEALGLSYIPPEIREDMGEIQAAELGKLPQLVEEKDIQGIFHCHTTDSDGHHTLEEMVSAAEKSHLKYIGIADHSKSSFQANGMDEKQLLSQIERIHKINKSKKFSTHIFSGVECDILKNGELDFPNEILKELDYVIVSIHSSFKMEEKKMTARLIKAIENPYCTMVGHVTGRLLLQRDPYAVNIPKVIDACIANQKIMELNAHPMRLDLDWRLWHKAAEKGLKCCINPDAHHTSDIQYYRAGVNIARKGWLEKKDIINTLSLHQIRALFTKMRRG